MAGSDQAAWKSKSHIRNTCTDPQAHSCAVLCDFVVWPSAAHECNVCQNAVPVLAACQNRSAFNISQRQPCQGKLHSQLQHSGVGWSKPHSKPKRPFWHSRARAAPTGLAARRDNQQRSPTVTCHRSNTDPPLCLPRGSGHRASTHAFRLADREIVHDTTDQQSRKSLQAAVETLPRCN